MCHLSLSYLGDTDECRHFDWNNFITGTSTLTYSATVLVDLTLALTIILCVRSPSNWNSFLFHRCFHCSHLLASEHYRYFLTLPPPQYARLLGSERSGDPIHTRMTMRHSGKSIILSRLEFSLQLLVYLHCTSMVGQIRSLPLIFLNRDSVGPKLIRIDNGILFKHARLVAQRSILSPLVQNNYSKC
jgi:hypothetical protein